MNNKRRPARDESEMEDKEEINDKLLTKNESRKNRKW